MVTSLLYCFDRNYNQQAFSSMISFLDNTTSHLDIYIIHKSESTSNFIPDIIKNHIQLRNIKTFKFNLKSKFPNIEGTHVSEATYYRIFFEYFIDSSIEFITYIDSDIICNKEPKIFIEQAISKLRNSNNILACKTERMRNQENKHIFDRINMSSDRYFNAGVIVIDTKKWKSQNITNKLIAKLNQIDFPLNFWDQDLFNLFFDGDYVPIDESCNWNIHLEKTYSSQEESIIFNSVVLFHFYGKTKPWSSRGLFSKYSFIYQQNYRKISNMHYHIIHNYFPNSLIQLSLSFLNLNFYRYIDKKTIFLSIFFKNYIIKRFKK